MPGLKPPAPSVIFMPLAARLKPCPDTKQGLSVGLPVMEHPPGDSRLDPFQRHA
jgi:hypothetical protein